jgi:hypothetical protein
MRKAAYRAHLQVDGSVAGHLHRHVLHRHGGVDDTVLQQLHSVIRVPTKRIKSSMAACAVSQRRRNQGGCAARFRVDRSEVERW